MGNAKHKRSLPVNSHFLVTYCSLYFSYSHITYTAPVLEGRLLGTVSKSSPVTSILLFISPPTSSHLQLDGHPEIKFRDKMPAV